MSEHTPGPWRVEALNRDTLTIRSRDGAVVANTPAHSPANAALIAAAPDLLEALKALIPFMNMAFAAEGDTFGFHRNDANDALISAERTIAKAEGRV